MDSDSFEVKAGFVVTHSRSTIGISPRYTVCGRSARRFSEIIMPSLALNHKFFFQRGRVWHQEWVGILIPNSTIAKKKLV